MHRDIRSTTLDGCKGTGKPCRIGGRIGQIGVRGNVPKLRRVPGIPDIARQSLDGRVVEIDGHVVGPRQAAAVREKSLRIVIGWEHRLETRFPVEMLPIPVFPVGLDSTLPVWWSARDVDQNPVKSVPALQLHERLRERLRIEPNIRRRRIAVKEVMAEGKLAHHRDAVRLLMIHRQRHALFRIHAPIVLVERSRIYRIGVISSGRSLSLWHGRCHTGVRVPEPAVPGENRALVVPADVALGRPNPLPLLAAQQRHGDSPCRESHSAGTFAASA